MGWRRASRLEILTSFASDKYDVGQGPHNTMDRSGGPDQATWFWGLEILACHGRPCFTPPLAQDWTFRCRLEGICLVAPLRGNSKGGHLSPRSHVQLRVESCHQPARRPVVFVSQPAPIRSAHATAPLRCPSPGARLRIASYTSHVDIVVSVPGHMPLLAMARVDNTLPGMIGWPSRDAQRPQCCLQVDDEA